MFLRLPKKLPFNIKDINPENENTDEVYKEAFKFVSEYFEAKDLKTQFITWATNNKLDLSIIEKLPDYHFVMAGKLAWLLNNGAILSTSSQEFFEKSVDKINRAKPKVDNKAPKLGIKERRAIIASKYDPKVKFIELYNDLDDLILENKMSDRSIDSIINSRVKLDQEALIMLGEYWRDRIGEYTTARHPENAEYFEKLSDETLKKRLHFSENVLTKINALLRTDKKVKKSRDVEFDIEILNMSKLSGRKAATLYDAKNKRVGIIYADSSDGLKFENNKIVGFNAESSFYKTLRFPEKYLSQLQAGSLKRNELILKEMVSGKIYPVSERISKDTVLIKIF